MKTRIHVNVNVGDLDRSIAFYRALFGAAPSKVKDDYANFRLEEPALHLALVHVPDHAPRKTDQHFGVELFDDDVLTGWQQRITDGGLRPRIEEQVTCCYAVANKFWVADPDGNEWEFWVRSAEADAMHGAEASEGECCAPMPLTTLEGLGQKTHPSSGSCCG